jgi:hypothetical protein
VTLRDTPMKKAPVILLSLSLFLSCRAFGADALVHTGAGWPSLNPEEKFMVIFSSMVALDSEGVRFDEPPYRYIRMIDIVVERFPELQSEDITNLLAAIVYQWDPATRQALLGMDRRWRSEKLERHLLAGYTGIRQ